MQTDKNRTRNLGKMLESIALIVVPLVIVLLIGFMLRSFTKEPVAQAKPAPTETPLPESTPVSTVASSTDNRIPASKMPPASFQTVTANDVTIYAGNYRMEAGQLLMDVCFDMLDESDWMIWGTAPVMDSQGYSVGFTDLTVIEIRYPPALHDGKMKQHIVDARSDSYRDAPPNKKKGQRCDTLGYNLPERFDISSFTFTLDQIVRNPSESDTCNQDTDRLKKIQAALDKRKPGIKIKNKLERTEGGGSCSIEIVERPQDMTDTEVYGLISDQNMFIDLFGVRGPWVFQGSVK